MAIDEGAAAGDERRRSRVRRGDCLSKRRDGRVHARRPDFYFLELNGRIQVEHPVTELVTGVDLVEQQIRIAEGETLATSYAASGHAVEVRLYAEDLRTFLPQTGRIDATPLPAGIRVDAGVEEGDEIGSSYDPMIAKLVAHADTRTDALDRLSDALRETEIEGVTTNLPSSAGWSAPPRSRGRTTTSFLAENPPLSPHPDFRSRTLARSMEARQPCPAARRHPPTSSPRRTSTGRWRRRAR